MTSCVGKVGCWYNGRPCIHADEIAGRARASALIAVVMRPPLPRTLGAMLRGRLWGRPRWLWGVEIVVVVGFVVVFFITDKTATKIIAAGLVVTRLAFVAVEVAERRHRERVAANDARND